MSNRVMHCPSPSCGLNGKRTTLGAIRGNILIVPHDATVTHGFLTWRITCPRCGAIRTWRGRIARDIPYPFQA